MKRISRICIIALFFCLLADMRANGSEPFRPGAGTEAGMAAKPTSEVCELWIENGSRKIYGIESVPTNVEKNIEKKKVAIVSHGFNGTSGFARDYFATLTQLSTELIPFSQLSTL